MSAIPIKDLPDGSFLQQRMGMSGQLQSATEEILNTTATLALAQPAAAIDSPLPSRVFQFERVPWSGRLPEILPQFWPVNRIIQATVGGSQQPVTIGTEQDLARGIAGLAISQPSGETIRVGYGYRAPCDFFITYLAGRDVLPPDLLEVFVELGFLIWKEKDRVGLTIDKTDVGQITFTRELPVWAQRTLNSYRRMAIFV
jgi:hypothetical protein